MREAWRFDQETIADLASHDLAVHDLEQWEAEQELWALDEQAQPDSGYPYWPA